MSSSHVEDSDPEVPRSGEAPHLSKEGSFTPSGRGFEAVHRMSRRRRHRRNRRISIALAAVVIASLATWAAINFVSGSSEVAGPSVSSTPPSGNPPGR